MRPILIFLLGAGSLWALKQYNKQQKGQGRILPQNQRGISTFTPRPTPQQPHQLYSSFITPPMASRQGGYVPGFGPYVDQVNPGDLYWNQA